MIYRLYPQTGTRLFTGKYGRYRIPYLPVKKMRELYPKSGFVIIGEIGGLAKVSGCQDKLLTSTGKEISIHPRGSMTRPFEWVAGYIAVGENTYVAVVRSLLPSFLRCLKR
jgi:phospholipase/carboxylesterase